MLLEYNHRVFHTDLTKIVTDIKSNTWQPDLIVGLARGGLVLAVHLSHRLNKEMISVNWPRQEDSRESCYYLGDLIAEGRKILFVDDITDTGLSIRSLLDHIQAGQIEELDMENVRVATLLWYEDSKLFKPDFYGKRLDREVISYVDFFWEKDME